MDVLPLNVHPRGPLLEYAPASSHPRGTGVGKDRRLSRFVPPSCYTVRSLVLGVREQRSPAFEG